jgi:hypothetical protein
MYVARLHMLRILILRVDCDTLYDVDDDEIENVHEGGYQYRHIPRHRDRYMGLVKVAADKIFARLASTCLGLSIVVFRLGDRKFLSALLSRWMRSSITCRDLTCSTTTGMGIRT